MLRLAAPVALSWIWLVFVAANVVDFAVQGVSSPRFGAVVSAILAFVTGLMYTLALRPRLVTDSTGITVLNPFRTHRIPWPLIQSVDTGEWVRVHYGRAAGPGPDNQGPDNQGPDNQEPGDQGPGDQDTAVLHCWALYVSARARRKIARGAPRQRQRGGAFGGSSSAARRPRRREAGRFRPAPGCPTRPGSWPRCLSPARWLPVSTPAPPGSGSAAAPARPPPRRNSANRRRRAGRCPRSPPP